LHEFRSAADGYTVNQNQQAGLQESRYRRGELPMFAIRTARSANSASHGNLSANTHACYRGNADSAGVPFGHFPALRNLLDAPLFTHLDRGIGTRINLDELAPEVSDRVHVTVRTDQGQVQVRATDLSLTDICVASARAIAEYGARVDVTLSYEGTAVALPAIAALQSGMYARSTFLFIDDEGEAESYARRDLGLIFHALAVEQNNLLHQRSACFVLSAICSLMFIGWMVS
jgi:hypothetical protein